ncbi:MAG: hypothetical protein AAF750_00300 [Planctomycetota bacterium]
MMSLTVLGSPSAADHIPTNPTGGWTPLPFVTAEARAAGVRLGGEGCQWPQSIEVDAVDGRLMLFLTDVGGLWRSLDGAQTWEPCNVGFTPRGANDAAIDPHFPSRVIAVGMNSMSSPVNGLYLSEDSAASWRPVQRVPMSGFADRRRKVAFDPTTRDDAAGMTRVVYWSRTDERHKPDNWGGMTIDPGLYRSDDGGRTWQRLSQHADEAAGHSSIDVTPDTGRLLAGNDRGIFVSDDRGETFRQVDDQPITSLSVSPKRPGHVFATRADAVLHSTDHGETWVALKTTGLDEPLRHPDGTRSENARTGVRFQDIAVSPADPDRIAMTSDADNWRFGRHVSHDGGKTWHTAAVEAGHAFMPQNERHGVYAWHPTDPERVWSFGGDWPSASVDGGHTYTWAGEGQNAVYVAGRFSLNPHHPGLLFLASQDYNGAVTEDHGHTWRYTNITGLGWGGFNYGGVAISPDVIVTGEADGGWGVPRQLRISRDGGSTWADVPGLTWVSDRSKPSYGTDSGLIHPLNPDIAFVGPFRTDDGGQTWHRPAGCSGAIAADNQGHVYGILARPDDTDLVVSRDAGATWQKLLTVPGTIKDLAVSPNGSHLFLASRDRLWRVPTDLDPQTVLGNPLTLIDTPPTDTGRYRIATVAVDPRFPDGRVLYAGQRIDLHVASHGVLRSTDGGQTWTNLNRTDPLDGNTLDGGREPQCIRVDPHTGDLYVTTGCYGVWRYPATPLDNDTDSRP